MITLKTFQLDAIEHLHNAMSDTKRNIILESGTGSGKTVILTHFIEEFMVENPGYATIWFSPGAGNLEEQSKEKMDKYIPNANTKTLETAISRGFNEKDTVFINWELVTKKGNKALADSERNNLIDRIIDAHDRGIKFIVVIDEEHLNKTVKSIDVIDMFKPTKVIRASATPKKDTHAIHILVPEKRVIGSGLIKRLLVINENVNKMVEVTSQVGYLLDMALNKREQLQQAFIKQQSNVNPLIVIQLPNNSDELLLDVEKYLETKGITYENGLLAVWLADKKEHLDSIDENNAIPKVIIIKQAIATGWDCPRAHILVKLRSNMAEAFEIQTIGRIRRMPEGKHYGIPLLDNCYLYTFDEKFKKGVHEYLGEKALTATTLALKSEYREFKLTKKKISTMQYEVSPLHMLEAYVEFLKLEYGLKPGNFKVNKDTLETYNFDFDDDIKIRTYAGEVSTLKQQTIQKLDHITLKVKMDTHEHGRIFHQTMSKIGRTIGLTYDSISTIIRRVFCAAPQSKGKMLNLTPKELYAFVLNNAYQIECDLKCAISNKKYRASQLELTDKDIEENFTFPLECTFTYDDTISDYDMYEKNVYNGYISSASPRSTGEVLFEQFINEKDVFDWFYKNGDKGQEFFSIVYMDNAGHKHHFYPDYILSRKGEIWIIEVKGGESASGQDENIDIYAEKKVYKLLEYANEYNITGAVVRYNKADMRLYISTSGYVDDMSDNTWIRLDKYFGSAT